MSDKKLLEEGAIRRFQTLANIKPIANGLLEEASKTKKTEKPKKEPVKESYAQEEESLEEMSGMDKKHYEEESMEEAEGEMEAPETAAAAEGGDKGDEVRSALESIKSGVDALMGMIEGAGDLGFEVEEEPEAGGEGEMPEMSGEEESGEEEQEEGLAEMKHSGKHAAKAKKHMKGGKMNEAVEEEEEEEEESLEETLDEEALAEELTRRVAARLMREAKKGGASWGAKPPSAGKGSKPKNKGNASKSNWGTKKGTKGHA
jgi:hypothetical protein